MGILTEYIFSHAVALNQSGRLRSNIYVHNRDVYILNSDHTVLIQFQLPKREPTFSKPIAFAANDYDSEDFTEEDGKIIFTRKADGLVRRKICAGTVDGGFDNIAEIFQRFWKSFLNAPVEINFTAEHLSLLEDSLSHLEFKAKEGKWLLTQRDIYTGNRIEIEDNTPEQTILKSTKQIPDFGPIGIRTNDFTALFQFNDLVSFYFFPDGQYCLFMGNKFDMRGMLAGCVFDEIGTIETVKEKSHGRKKSQDRPGEPKTDSTSGKRTRRRRT